MRELPVVFLSTCSFRTYYAIISITFVALMLERASGLVSGVGDDILEEELLPFRAFHALRDR